VSRLGLRAFEIAALTLDDIDWRAGELTIHGKGAQTDRLPLSREVGQALSRPYAIGVGPGSVARCSCARSRRMERCR
jgi:integrase